MLAHEWQTKGIEVKDDIIETLCGYLVLAFFTLMCCACWLGLMALITRTEEIAFLAIKTAISALYGFCFGSWLLVKVGDWLDRKTKDAKE